MYVVDAASGLKWVAVGTTEPSAGEELTNEKLSTALLSQGDFTQEEWDTFGIKSLLKIHFVKTGDTYFKPVDTDAETLKVERWPEESVYKLPDRGRCRKRCPLADTLEAAKPHNSALAKAKQPTLVTAEIIAAILYTGPVRAVPEPDSVFAASSVRTPRRKPLSALAPPLSLV